MRDNQRSRVYAAERGAFKWGQTIPNHELSHWLETQILSRAWFRRRWGNQTVHVELGKGGGQAMHNLIRLGVGARNEWVFCHELAHVLTRQDPGHGTAFASVYLFLIKQVLGKDAEARLRAAFQMNRVKTRPSAVPAATTFNLKTLAPRAKAKAPKPVKKPRRGTLADVEREAKKIGATVRIERLYRWGKPLAGEWDLYVTPPVGQRFAIPGYEVIEELDDGSLFTSAYRGSAFTAADRCEEMLWAIGKGLRQAAA